MAKAIMKKVVAAVKAVAAKTEKKVKEPKAPRITAASIVVEILGRKLVPTDDKIIEEVLGKLSDAGVVSKFQKTHLAWYKYQYKQGRFNDGEAQVINQEEKPKAEKPAKAAPAVKTVKKAAKKVAAPAEEEEEA